MSFQIHHGVCIGGPLAGSRYQSTGSQFAVAKTVSPTIVASAHPEDVAKQIPLERIHYDAGTIRDRDGIEYPVWVAQGVEPIAELLAHYQRTARGR